MTQKRQWSLITGLVCLAVLAAGFVLLVKPQNGKASSVRSQTADVQQQVGVLQAQLAQLQSEREHIAGEQAALERYVEQLPKDPQLPTLLRKVQVAADTAKVDLTTLSPAPPGAFTAPGAAPAAGGTAADAGTSGLQVINVSMTVSGSYFHVEDFLDQVEKLKRSMLVNTFTIATGGTSSAGASGGSGAADGTTGAGSVTVTIAASVFEAPTLGQASATSTTTSTTAAPATAGSGS